jgi:hypothetical protein
MTSYALPFDGIVDLYLEDHANPAERLEQEPLIYADYLSTCQHVLDRLDLLSRPQPEPRKPGTAIMVIPAESLLPLTDPLVIATWIVKSRLEKR